MTPRRRGLAAVCLVILGAGASAACAPRAHPAATPTADGADTAGVLAAHHAWWRALTFGDTAHLRAHSTARATLTMSGGQTLDGPGILRQAATHTGGAQLVVTWSDVEVRRPAPGVAIVTSRMREAIGAAGSTYRFLTILEREERVWRVAAAQSTRELELTPRVPLVVAGVLADFVGSYRTPRGASLRILQRDSALLLVEPSGREVPLEPIGPGLFELGAVSAIDGVVRFAFTRDAAGRVTALTRLVTGHSVTFPRIP